MRSSVLIMLFALAACRPEGAKATPEQVPSDNTEASDDTRSDNTPSADDEPKEVLVTPSAKVIELEGQTLLAVDFALAEGWHVYWQNPGDSGLATKVKAQAGGGELGDALYPAPERFQSPGGLTSYGYEHSATLFVPLDSAPSGAIEIEASWLACRESCVRGKKSLSAMGTPAPAEAQHTEAFARLPKAADELPGKATWQGKDLVLALDSGASGAVADFFPMNTDPAMLHKIEISQGAARLTYTRTDGGERAQGVVAVESDDTTTFYRVASPWPAAD